MLADSGQSVAKAHYGARGWVVHHNTDLWRGAAPINASNHGIWLAGGAWLCQHLWEHYLFTGDKKFLAERAYPADERRLGVLPRLPRERPPAPASLISGPSNSPEQGGLVMGPTMDHEIIRGLFANTATAAAISGCDAEFAAKLDDSAKADRPASDRPLRPVAGMAGRQGRPEEQAPPRLAPVGRLSGR